MQTTTATTTTASTCAPALPEPAWQRAIFPPHDADADTYRRWIAASPWPEVVFAAAGAR